MFQCNSEYTDRVFYPGISNERIPKADFCLIISAGQSVTGERVWEAKETIREKTAFGFRSFDIL